MAADFVDLTLDSEDEGPLFARLAQRISPLKDSRATKPGRSPGRRPLSPVHNNSPKLQGPPVARGLAAEDAAAGAQRKTLGAGPARDTGDIAAEQDWVARLLEDIHPLDQAPAVPAAAAAATAPVAARPARRHRQARGLAGLAGAFSTDWDLSLPLPAAAPGPAAQQQQLPSRAGSGDWAGGLPAGAAGPLLGAAAEGRYAPPRAGAGAAAPIGQQAQQQAQLRLGRQPLAWEFEEGTQDDDAGAELGDNNDVDLEWMPEASQPMDADDDAPKKKRRGKKTEEEKAREAEEKARQRAEKAAERQRLKEQREAEKASLRAAKKQTKQYGSKEHALKWMTVLLDPRLMNTPMGLKIAETLQEVQGKAGDKGVSTDVRSCGLEPYRAIKWLRKAPQHQSQFEESQQAELLESQQGMGPLVDMETPHVMVCMQAEEFVVEVQRDRLESLWDILDERCPGYHASLTVCGLNSYLTSRERREGARNLQAGKGEVGFIRGPIEDFVAGLAIECPSLGFRDVVDTAQAGEHVLSFTKAIAQDPYKPDDATLWLGAHSKKDTQAWGQLLASHPLADKGVETLAKALYAMPVHSLNPGVAHAVALEYRSLGALMEALLDSSRPDRDKQRVLENLLRTTTGKVMRVGPTAAKQLVELLTCQDPDMLIKGGSD